MIIGRVVLAFLAVSTGCPALGADSPGFYYTQGSGAYQGGPGPGGGSAGGYTFGWQFTPTTSITVTALGVADTFATGFVFSHSLFLWDISGNLLRTAVAPAGPDPGGALGANDYRYYAVTPVQLTAGQSYVIAVGFPATAGQLDPSDVYYGVYAAASYGFDPRITWVGGRISGALNAFPTEFRGTGSAGLSTMGACNFLIAPTPPPCPADLNGDRVINTGDLTLLLAQFGQTASPPGSGADINGDGAVNTADLTIFLAKFGSACP